MKKIEGTPLQIGQNVFIEICNPIIARASEHMNEQQLVRLYAGIMAALFGSMAADFGPDKAIEVIDVISESFANQAHQLTTLHTMQ